MNCWASVSELLLALCNVAFLFPVVSIAIHGSLAAYAIVEHSRGRVASRPFKGKGCPSAIQGEGLSLGHSRGRVASRPFKGKGCLSAIQGEGLSLGHSRGRVVSRPF